MTEAIKCGTVEAVFYSEFLNHSPGGRIRFTGDEMLETCR